MLESCNESWTNPDSGRDSGTTVSYLNTHICVLIIKLHHHVGGTGHRFIRVPENLNLVEDERLVPGGVEGITHRYCLLGLMEE